jgi:hypothetical protein
MACLIARGYRDFSDMPDEALRALADDLANPSAAMKRIRAKRKAEKIRRTVGEQVTEKKAP